MVTQFDEKGKIFTPVVKKKPALVTIQTNQHMIRGTVHVHPGTRLKDDLNGQEQFLAVTDAIVLNHHMEELYRSEFLAVNIQHIVWVIPDEEILR